MSCSDFNVLGGSKWFFNKAITEQKQDTIFAGGDKSNPSKNVCKYYSSPKLGDCVFEGCTNVNGFQGDLKNKSGVPSVPGEYVLSNENVIDTPVNDKGSLSKNPGLLALAIILPIVLLGLCIFIPMFFRKKANVKSIFMFRELLKNQPWMEKYQNQCLKNMLL